MATVLRPGIGTSRRKTLLFKEQRARRQATASEEQKVVLRLETLLFQGPVTRGGKGKRERKDYEKSVVLWTHNSLAKLCTGCGGKFTTMRRRHHCRLCGDVLCSKCSLGLDVKSASEVCRIASSNRTGKAIKNSVVVKEDQDMRVCRFCHGALQSIHHKVGRSVGRSVGVTAVL